MKIDQLTGAIIADAIAVHRELGPGLLESTYEVCLEALMRRRGFEVRRQLAIPVVFQGMRVETGLRVDLLVESRVVLELKTVTRLEPVHYAQLHTYLKFSGCSVGLLINFNVKRLHEGLRRVVRGYTGDYSPHSPAAPTLGD